MPIYEYECRACKHRFERIQKFSDRHMRTCPDCKGRVDRMAHAPAIQFKGSGFYINDYSDKGKASQKAAKGEARSEAKSSDKKSDSGKSETKKADAGKSKSKD